MQVRCPQCHTPVELRSDGQLSDIACPSCGSSFSLLGTVETAPYETGTKTIGHFDLVEQIGLGTFGFVWKARDMELDRTVALKIPRKGQLDPEETEQFLREARAAAQLRHPNIVSVHEVGRERDTVFIVSDFVEGVTLADRLTAQRFSCREAAELCAKIANALQHAHEAGVIHRDLKPGNVILDSAGEPHIMDFGLARREAGEVTMTVEGRVLGTPAYMSPEQAKGAAHTADRRSDVYSLGVILFEMLTGERPFRGNIRMLVHQVINDEPPSPRRLNGAVSRDLETICLKCLEKEPWRRYVTAQAMADDVRRFLVGEPLEARPITRLERGWRWSRKNRVVAALAGTVTALLIVIALVSSYVAQASRWEAKQRRRLLYMSDMNLAGAAWQRNDLGMMKRLLDRYRPSIAGEDMRKWEWHFLSTLLEENANVPSVSFANAILRISVGNTGRCMAIAHPNGVMATVINLDDGKRREFGRQSKYGYNVNAFAALSVDSGTVAFPADDSASVVLHDLRNNESKIVTTPSKACGARFSPDGQTLAIATLDSGVLLYNQESQQLTGLKGDPGPVYSIEFSADGRYLATGGKDSKIHVWDAQTASELSCFLAHVGTVFSLAFSPDGTHLASGGADGALFIWDTQTWTRLKTLAIARDQIRAVAFSRDGRYIAANVRDGTVRIWSVPDFESKKVIRGTAGAFDLAFLPDGTLMVGTQQGRVVMLDRNSQTERGVLKCGSGTGSLVYSVADNVLWATDGQISRRVSRWRLKGLSAEEMEPLDAPCRVACIAVSESGVLALGDYDGGAVHLFELAKQEYRQLSVGNTSSRVMCLGFSSDGERLGVGYENGSLVVWQVGNRQKLLDTPIHQDAISTVCFCPRSGAVLTGGRDGRVMLWNVDRNECEHDFGDQGTSVHVVGCSPDERCIAAGLFTAGGPEVRRLVVWDRRSYCERVLHGHNYTVRAVSFLEDGDTLLSVGGDRMLKVWDLTMAQERLTIEEDSRIFETFATLPGDRIVAARYRDGTIRLIRAGTPE